MLAFHMELTDVPSKETIRCQQLVQQAEGYLELGMPEHAIEMLDRVERGQFSSHGLYLYGEALRSLERYGEATEWLQSAADAAPQRTHIWLALGWCCKRIGRVDLAIEALENALAADPGEAIVHYNLACYWSLARRKARALRYLAKAFEIDSRYRDLVGDEPDFDPLRNDSDFQALTSLIA